MSFLLSAISNPEKVIRREGGETVRWADEEKMRECQGRNLQRQTDRQTSSGTKHQAGPPRLYASSIPVVMEMYAYVQWSRDLLGQRFSACLFFKVA